MRIKALAVIAIVPAITAWTLRISQPPSEFSGPYRGQLTEHILPLEDVPATCKAMGTASAYSWACATPRGSSCTIVIPAIGKGVTASMQQEIRRHELGHCNGWPGDHRGWR